MTKPRSLDRLVVSFIQLANPKFSDRLILSKLRSMTGLYYPNKKVKQSVTDLE